MNFKSLLERPPLKLKMRLGVHNTEPWRNAIRTGIVESDAIFAVSAEVNLPNNSNFAEGYVNDKEN